MPVQAKQGRSADTIAWFNMSVAVVQAALIAGFGFVLKDRFDQTLRERQAAVAAIGAMNSLVVEYQKKIEPVPGVRSNEGDRRRGIALHLAMYGADAAMPLLGLAVGTPGSGPTEALYGLRLVASRHPESVCQVLQGAYRVRAMNCQFHDEISAFANDLRCAIPAKCEVPSS